VRMHLNIWLNLMLIVVFSLLLCGCLEDNKPSVAMGNHLKLMNMGQYIVELNLTDNNEYDIGNVTTDNGNIKTGPPDCFTYSNYTRYHRDIMDKMGGERKLSLDIRHYDAITPSKDSLLEHGLSTWPWDGSNSYESHYIGGCKWITIKGSQENEIDAACWIDDNTMLSLRMFNLNQSESMAILGSVTFRS
jgi:hypothetical protein